MPPASSLKIPTLSAKSEAAHPAEMRSAAMARSIVAYLTWVDRLLFLVPKLSELLAAPKRTIAFLRAWHYLRNAHVAGDYYEFGVSFGTSFKANLRAARHTLGRHHATKFFAFDSFSGLPTPDSAHDTTAFQTHEYACARPRFERYIRRAARGQQVHIVEGFFDATLTESLRTQLPFGRAAFINIDCDLFQSTISALRFVTPYLQNGTVIYFDDWYFSGPDMNRGESGACRQWLRENPEIRLHDFGEVATMGKMFLVEILAPQA